MPQTITKEAPFKFQGGVYFSQKDRENHTHVIGSTGTGKSKFLEYLIRQDIENPNVGLCLIDPHGTLYDEILEYVSYEKKELANRVILFNPSEEVENILGFNPIPKIENNIDYVLEMLISGCLKVWGQNTHDYPRITRWLENIFYTLTVNNMTFREASVLVSATRENKHLREAFYEKIDYLPVLEDWMNFERSSTQKKIEIMEGVGNRLRPFFRSEIIKNIIGRQTKTLDLRSIMDEGKILLVNLDGKTNLSHQSISLLGIMLVNEIFRVARTRNPNDSDMKPFYFYIDEFGQFVTHDIARALEECRKFKLFMILAHQHLEQLKKDDGYLYSSIMTNCKNKVVFGGLSVEDTKVMVDELATGFVDLKRIKDEMYTTRTLQREGTRTIIKENLAIKGESKGRTTRESRSSSNSKSMGGSISKSFSIGKGQNTGQTRGSSHSDSQSIGHSQSSSFGHSTSFSESQSQSRITNEGKDRSTSHSENKSQSQTRSKRKSQTSEEGGTAQSQRQGISNNESQGVSYSEFKGGNTSQSEGGTKTVVPWYEQTEYQELSKNTFWTRDELLHMEVTDIKNQGVREAFIKLGNKPTIQTKINLVKSDYFSEHTPLQVVQEFKDRVFLEHSAYYSTIEEVQDEARERQEMFFGEPLELQAKRFQRFKRVQSTPEIDEIVRKSLHADGIDNLKDFNEHIKDHYEDFVDSGSAAEILKDP